MVMSDSSAAHAVPLTSPTEEPEEETSSSINQPEREDTHNTYNSIETQRALTLIQLHDMTVSLCV